MLSLVLGCVGFIATKQWPSGSVIAVLYALIIEEDSVIMQGHPSSQQVTAVIHAKPQGDLVACYSWATCMGFNSQYTPAQSLHNSSSMRCDPSKPSTTVTLAPSKANDSQHSIHSAAQKVPPTNHTPGRTSGAAITHFVNLLSCGRAFCWSPTSTKLRP